MENSIKITDEIEKVTADFFDSEVAESPEGLYRIDTNQGRIYAREVNDKDGNRKVDYRHSVTTVISHEYPNGYYLDEYFKNNKPEIIQWTAEQSSNYGTYLHYKWGSLLKGQGFSLNYDAVLDDLKGFCDFNAYDYISIKEYLKIKKRSVEKDILGFIQFRQDYKVEPIMIEFPIFGEKVAGFADLLCYMDYEVDKGEKERIVALIDWKSGINDFYENYVIQLEGYYSEFSKVYDGITIDKIFNYGCKNYRIPIGKTVIPYRLKDQTESPIRKKWKNIVENFFMTDRSINNKVKFKDMVVDINTDIRDTYLEVDLLQSVLDIEAEEAF